MADRYNGFSKKWRRDEEFDEEDVWGVGKEREERGSLKVWKASRDSLLSGSSSSAWCLPTAPRVIPRATSGTTIGSNTSSHEGNVPHQQLSPPVNIPDRAKDHLNNNNKISNALANGTNGLDLGDKDNDVGQNDDEEDDGEMVPPHEYIARRLARSQIASFSMCEGVGRTLKGRDLSKLRNAILTKTGFLE